MTNGSDINKRANTDPAFRDQLKADPTTAIPGEPAVELEEAKLDEVVGGVHNPQTQITDGTSNTLRSVHNPQGL